MVYKVEEGQLILVRTGSHSELFGGFFLEEAQGVKRKYKDYVSSSD
ncbi:MAG: hypothetical protein ACQKBU_02010 [Verrucomicrobiales bacterium]